MSSVDLLNDLEASVVDTALSKLQDDIIESLELLSESALDLDVLVYHFLRKLDDDAMYDFVIQIQSIEKNSLKEIIYTLYVRIGRNHYRNLFKNLCISDFIQYFPVGGRFGKRAAVSLMNEILQVQECSITEIQEFDESFINLLLDDIESERDDDEYSNEMLKLLLNVQDQFDSKSTSLPDLNQMINRTLASRTKSTKTLSENIIFLFNRSIDTSLKRQLSQFTRRILEESEVEDFFYFNDLIVLLDVTLREIQSTDADNENLLHEMIYLLPILTKQCELQANSPISHKKHEVISVLKTILSSDCCLTLKKIISKTLDNQYLKD